MKKQEGLREGGYLSSRSGSCMRSTLGAPKLHVHGPLQAHWFCSRSNFKRASSASALTSSMMALLLLAFQRWFCSRSNFKRTGSGSARVQTVALLVVLLQWLPSFCDGVNAKLGGR